MPSLAYYWLALVFTAAPALPWTVLVQRISGHNAGFVGRSPSRQWLKGQWVRVGGIPPDSLLQPFLVNASASQVVVFDYGDSRLKTFSLDGRLNWASGRKGEGPWEFDNPTDLQVTAEGEIWLADPFNARIDVFRLDGRPARMISLGFPVSRIAPLGSGKGMLALNHSLVFFARYDDKGNAEGAVRVPDILAGVHVLAAEPIARIASDNRVVVAFRWSGSVLVLGPDGRVSASTQGIEPISFPETKNYTIKTKSGQEVQVFRTDPKAVWAAYGVTVRDSKILVLYRGATQNAGKIIDTYDLAGAKYLGSMLLPNAAIGLAAVGENLAVLYDDPEPHVEIMRWEPGE